MKLKCFPTIILCFFVWSLNAQNSKKTSAVSNYNSREYWVKVLTKIADPVLINLSENKLRAKMPLESKTTRRNNYSHIEAAARTIAGIAPWLELGVDQTPEGQLRKKYLILTQKALKNAFDSTSPDYCQMARIDGSTQALVEASFFSQALIAGYTQLWLPLDSTVKNNIVRALQKSRSMKPNESNWLLFSAEVEAFLLKAGYQWESKPIEYALKRHAEWYKGDGVYGDGPDFHWDYYNSFVIQPVILDVTKILEEKGIVPAIPYNIALKRSQRFAEIQERLISPEGTYPPTGRSLAYRFGAFHNLSKIALMQKLPSSIKPEQVRSALSEVIHRQIEAPGTFNENGWLNIGFSGHQLAISENYISTGSIYLCTLGLIPLGLPATDPFWTAPAADWTSKKVWNGIDIPEDHSYVEKK